METRTIFEVADDSLQGVLGYHFYVMALHQSVDPNRIETYLPNTSRVARVDAFPHTFSWDRYYLRKDLILAFMPPFFELYQSRVSITAIASVFDDALTKFMGRLRSLGYPQQLNGRKLEDHSSYKERIEWAFYESKKCTVGDLKAIARLSKTFGIIDEVRLLRNLIMHNHGIFDKGYENGAIKSKDIERVVHPDYKKFKDTGKGVAIILNYADIINSSRAHIEVLHMLHNQIQKAFFNHPEPYDYEKENKIIMWNSVFWGDTELGNVREAITRDSYLKI